MPVWKFYVYQFDAADGSVAYIGKGSGRRLLNQSRKFCLAGREIARFLKEADAYAFERVLIAERQPSLNVCAGGNGNRALSARPKPKWMREIETVGLRRYAAMLALTFGGNGISQDDRDRLHRVAAPWATV